MLRVNEKTRELIAYGDIGPSWAGMISAMDFVDGLDKLGAGDIHLRLNSPGGTADEAFAAVELLRRHEGDVSVTVDSLAASAATFFLHPDFKVDAAKTARFMMHYSLTITYGNAKDHAKTIDILNAYDSSIVKAYGRVNLPEDELRAILDAETWFGADRALELGLIDSINDSDGAPAAKIREGLYRNTPKDLLERPVKDTPARRAAAFKIMELKAKWKAR